MVESELWAKAQEQAKSAAGTWRELFKHTLWSGLLFPTLLRSTAQGFMFGVVRIALGGWSTVQQAGFRTLALVLAGMLIVSGVSG